MFLIKKEIQKILYLILNLLVNLRLSFLSSFVIFLSLRKIKGFNCVDSDRKKNLIVLEKSHGIEDIKIAYENIETNLVFFVLQRKIFSIIFKSFFKKNSTELRDNLYITNNPLIEKKKTELLNFLDKVLFNLNKFINISAFISFNYKYYAERELHTACKNNKIKFIVCHKECNVFDGEIEYYNQILKNNIGKFNGDLITVYNERYKDLLVKNEIVIPEKVKIVGMPRSDVYFNTDNNQQKHVLVFLISIQRSLKYIYETKSKENLNSKENSVNWDKLAIDTVEATLDIARKFPDLQFIFKTKIENDIQTLTQQQLIKKAKLLNCKIIYGGNSIKLIKDADIVIGFNTTGIIESLISNKKVIVPFMNIADDDFKKKFVLDDYNLTFKPNTKNELKDLMISLIENKNNNDKIFKEDDRYKKLFFEHLGNNDGTSSQKLRKIFDEMLN